MVAFLLDYFNLNQLWFSLDHIFHQIKLKIEHLYKLKIEHIYIIKIEYLYKLKIEYFSLG